MASTVPADVIGQLRQSVADWKKTPNYKKVVQLTDGVLARFQPFGCPPPFDRPHLCHMTT